MTDPIKLIEIKAHRSEENGKQIRPSTGFDVKGEAFPLPKVLRELVVRGKPVYSDAAKPPADENVE